MTDFIMCHQTRPFTLIKDSRYYLQQRNHKSPDGPKSSSETIFQKYFDPRAGSSRFQIAILPPRFNLSHPHSLIPICTFICNHMHFYKIATSNCTAITLAITFIHPPSSLVIFFLLAHFLN